MDFLEGGSIFSVVLRTTGIFLFAFVILRFLGKKHLTHLTYLDLLLVITMGSAVGDVMIYSEGTVRMLSSMAALGTVALLIKLLDTLSLRSATISRLISGTARVVVDHGKLLHEELAKERMSEEEFLTLLREKGFDSVKDTKKVFIESDGEISVVPK